MKKSLLVIATIVLLALQSSLVQATSFNDLTSYQKQKYWQMMSQDCIPLLKQGKYSDYRTCALATMDKASKLQEASSAWCTDSDGIDFTKKGIVKTDLNPNGTEDYIYTFGDGSKYLFEGACSSDKHYFYYQKNCAELGPKYVADVAAGACVLKNNAPKLTVVMEKTEIKEGEEYKIYLYGTDEDVDELTFSAENLPEGSVVDKNAPVPGPVQNGTQHAVFSWTPNFSQSGAYKVTFKVSDGTTVTTQAITINVVDFHGWLPMSTTGAPPSTYWGASVWTGEEMFVFGGFNGAYGTPAYGVSNSSGRYNPKTNTWKSVSSVNAPSPQQQSKMVWTGKEVILWGVVSDGAGGFQNNGARYNPKTDVWSTISTVNAPILQGGSTAIWTGNEMIVWGGGNADGPLNTGGIYNPQTNFWTAISTINAPTARQGHSAVWTGDKMIIWGGENGCKGTPPNVCISFNDGGIYDHMKNKWTPIVSDNMVDKRAVFNMVYTGKEMIVWGGYKYIGPGGTSIAINDGAHLNIATLEWTPLSMIDAPSKRHDNPVIWTGKEMIIWGGYNFPWDNTYTNTGAMYDPVKDVWTTMPLSGAPSARKAFVSEWTGSEMLIWGGWGGGVMSEGGRYIP